MIPFDRAVEALADRMTRGGYTLDRGEAEELVRAIELHGVSLDAADSSSDYYACRCEPDSDARQGVRCNLHASTDLQQAWGETDRIVAWLDEEIADEKRTPEARLSPEESVERGYRVRELEEVRAEIADGDRAQQWTVTRDQALAVVVFLQAGGHLTDIAAAVDYLDGRNVGTVTT